MLAAKQTSKLQQLSFPPPFSSFLRQSITFTPPSLHSLFCNLPQPVWTWPLLLPNAHHRCLSLSLPRLVSMRVFTGSQAFCFSWMILLCLPRVCSFRSLTQLEARRLLSWIHGFWYVPLRPVYRQSGELPWSRVQPRTRTWRFAFAS